MKSCFVLLIVLFTTGCGSLSTVSQPDSYARLNLNHVDTRCQSLPRVYSGVLYDICAVDSKAEQVQQIWMTSFHLIDIIPSALIDTILLPYTWYLQKEKGNINL